MDGNPNYSDFDVLIVGGGIFGISTAYHLALSLSSSSSDQHGNGNGNGNSNGAAGSRIAILDRGLAPSPLAASSDINKVVRADYSKAFYMELAYEALAAWQTTDWLSPFFHQTGWVMLNEKGSDLAPRIRSNIRASRHPDTAEDISLLEVKARWGGVFAGVDTTGFDSAYTNSAAGWADASGALQAMASKAVQLGVQYIVGEATSLLPVLHEADGGGRINNNVRGVATQDGRELTAGKILLATGAWTPWLMAPLEASLSIAAPDSITTQMQCACVCVAAFQLTAAEAEHYSQMPVFIYGGKGEVMPPPNPRQQQQRQQQQQQQQQQPHRLLKFTNAHTMLNTKRHPSCKRDISVPAQDQANIPRRLQEECIDLIEQRMPDMLAQGRLPDQWRLCWDAVSGDQNMLITQHPDVRLSNLYLATAGSFHSWKFLPTIGKYVVNVLEGRSNGPERDAAWAWKTSWADRGAHEKVIPRGELRDFE